MTRHHISPRATWTNDQTRWLLALRSERREDRLGGLASLAGDRSPDAAAVLIHLVRDDDAMTTWTASEQRRALELLAECGGESAVPVLVRVVSGRAPVGVRRMAVAALAVVGTPSARTALLRARLSLDGEIRRAAAAALARPRPAPEPAPEPAPVRRPGRPPVEPIELSESSEAREERSPEARSPRARRLSESSEAGEEWALEARSPRSRRRSGASEARERPPRLPSSAIVPRLPSSAILGPAPARLRSRARSSAGE